jgi:CHASE2 domain-containing sensor protein
VKSRLKAIGIEVAGWGLLVLAVLMSPLPVVPSLLLLGALSILSLRYSWALRLLQKTRRLLPARISNQ